MKKILITACLVILSLPGMGWSARLEPAKITLTVNSVNLAEPGGASREASVGDIFQGKTYLETGSKSRAQIVFHDQSIARLGANSVFAFSRGDRNLELRQGALLMQVPKNAGGAVIQTAAVTAAITGTTIAIEYTPASRNSRGTIKILVLEGSLRAYLRKNPGESVILNAGEMITLEPDARTLPEPEIFSIERLVRTSRLLSRKFPPLPSMGLILENIAFQKAEMAAGRLLVSNYTLHDRTPGGLQNVRNTFDNIALRKLTAQRSGTPPPSLRPPPRPPAAPFQHSPSKPPSPPPPPPPTPPPPTPPPPTPPPPTPPNKD